MKNQKERMLAEKLYLAVSEELDRDRDKNRRLTYEYNLTRHTEVERRQEIMQELLGKVGNNFNIQPPFNCDYGNNIYIGDNFYANYDSIILDVANVTIGDNVFFAPRVHIFTAGHPIDAIVRNTNLEFGKAVTIGDNVWVGGNTVINPGVTIGDNVVIGSGSVVTRDIPSNVVAAGNPCRVLREITDEDKAYWEAEMAAYYRDLEK